MVTPRVPEGASIAKDACRSRKDCLCTTQYSHSHKTNKIGKGAKSLHYRLEEGHDPHILDACEMIHEAWNEVSETTVARCWMKADILPRGIQAALSAIHGKVTGTRDPKKEFDILEISVDLSKLQLQASCDMARDLAEVCDEDIRKWIVIEDDYEVREALINDCLEAAEQTVTVITGL